MKSRTEVINGHWRFVLRDGRWRRDQRWLRRRTEGECPVIVDNMALAISWFLMWYLFFFLFWILGCMISAVAHVLCAILDVALLLLGTIARPAERRLQDQKIRQRHIESEKAEVVAMINEAIGQGGGRTC